jgi:hypothetical protein
MNSWYEILFEIDLVKVTKHQISFLKQVDLLGNLYEGYYLERALYRYKILIF